MMHPNDDTSYFELESLIYSWRMDKSEAQPSIMTQLGCWQPLWKLFEI